MKSGGSTWPLCSGTAHSLVLLFIFVSHWAYLRDVLPQKKKEICYEWRYRFLRMSIIVQVYNHQKINTIFNVYVLPPLRSKQFMITTKRRFRARDSGDAREINKARRTPIEILASWTCGIVILCLCLITTSVCVYPSPKPESKQTFVKIIKNERKPRKRTNKIPEQKAKKK